MGGSGALLAQLLLNPERAIESRRDSFTLLDTVSVRRVHDLGLASSAGTVVPLLWIRKACAASPLGLGRASSTGVDAAAYADASDAVSGTPTSLLTVSRPDGSPVPWLRGPAAVANLGRACSLVWTAEAGVPGYADPEELAGCVVAAPELEALRWIESHRDQLPGPATSGLLIDLAMGTPVLARLSGWEEQVRVEYVTTQTWRRRTIKASFGIEPTGIEFDIPRPMSALPVEVSVDAPEGCEILGAEIRETTGSGERRSLMMAKSPRRLASEVMKEAVPGGELPWRSEDRSRPSNPLGISGLSSERHTRREVTLWLSLERISLRPALMASLLLAFSSAAILVHLGSVAVPSAFDSMGFRIGGSGTEWTYKRLIGDSSSAAVTALLAPGILAGYLVRIGEHRTLGQLLRVVRTAVWIPAFGTMWQALAIGLGVRRTIFVPLATLTAAFAAALFLLLLVAYRRCERLPQRPSPVERRLAARWRSRLDDAQLWNRAGRPTEGEAAPAPSRERIYRALLRSTGGDLPGTRDLVEGAVARGKDLLVDGEVDGRRRGRQAKDLRRMPFGGGADVMFAVRLVKVRDLESAAAAAALDGRPAAEDDIVRRLGGFSASLGRGACSG